MQLYHLENVLIFLLIIIIMCQKKYVIHFCLRVTPHDIYQQPNKQMFFFFILGTLTFQHARWTTFFKCIWYNSVDCPLISAEHLKVWRFYLADILIIYRITYKHHLIQNSEWKRFFLSSRNTTPQFKLVEEKGNHGNTTLRRQSLVFSASRPIFPPLRGLEANSC